MGSSIQTGHEVAIKSVFGDDVLLFDRMHGREALSEPFKFELELSSRNKTLSAKTILGSCVSVTLNANGAPREFNGIVVRFSVGDYRRELDDSSLLIYKAVVRPRLWLLTRGSHCRFFHDLDVIEIVKKVLKDYQVDCRSDCIHDYPKLEHCVQYRETDFAFVSRLLEREGIYYYFEHRHGKDQLVLADAPSAHGPIPNYGTIGFETWLADGWPHTESVYRWEFDEALVAGVSEIDSFDFRNVKSSEQRGLFARASSSEGSTGYGFADYVACYTSEADGRRYADVRLQAHQAMAARARGSATARGIVPGGVFSLDGHPSPGQNGDYLVTEAEYRVDGHGYRTAASKGGAHPAFECEFAAIPKNKPFRAQARTPRPQAGLQTARVIAPEGDDIAAEKYLQVKVEFHWESFNPPAAGKRMQRAWVRVAQHWAGKSRGALFVPRAGEEVVVAFVDGDPDHPIVVGSVYNSSNETPYALPAHGAVSGIRTSSLGRDGERNELRFNDKDLQLLLYTGGRHDNYVKGESLTWVGKDAHLIVEKKQLMKLGEHHATVDGASHVKVGRGASWKAGADMVHEAGMTYAASGKNVRIHAGLNVVIEAGAELTLKAGSSFITLNPAGVQISSGAGLILLNSGGAAAVAPSASPGSPSEPKKADDGSSVK